MKKCSALVMISALSCAFAVPSARAATLEVISGPSGQRSVTFPAFGPLGQSFTAFDTNLQSVGFQFNALNPGSANAPFTLQLRAGSSLTGDVLYSTSFSAPASINSTAASWVDVAITGWNVTTGQNYTFVLSNSSFRNGIILGPEINIFNGQALGGDAYAGGTALFTSQPYQNFCLTSGICDLNFRVTAVTPAGAVPEPATWAMLIAGFGLAGVSLRRRARARRVQFG